MKGLTKFVLLVGSTLGARSVFKAAKEKDIGKKELEKGFSEFKKEVEEMKQINIVSGARKKTDEEEERRKKWLKLEGDIEKTRGEEREEDRQKEKIPWLPLDEVITTAILDGEGNVVGRPFYKCPHCGSIHIIPRGSYYKCDTTPYVLECSQCGGKIGWSKEKVEKFFLPLYKPDSYKQIEHRKKIKKRFKKSKKRINDKKLKVVVQRKLQGT